MFSKITTAWKLTLSLLVVSCLTALTPVPIASAGSVAPTRDACGLVKRDDGTFEIADEADLALFGQKTCGLASRYILTADIPWNKAWQGPAASNAPFTGSFDGGGHSISGLEISGVDASFISYTNGATIKNLSFGAVVNGGLGDSTATAGLGSAGVVHEARTTTITNVQVSGSITATGVMNQCVGGLIGESFGSTIQNSSFQGNITASGEGGWYVGGLVGCAYHKWDIQRNSVIKESYFQGSINAYASAGGLVGFLLSSDVINSYAVGTVSGETDSIGGLVGWNDRRQVINSIKNSFASVRLRGSSEKGALVGYSGNDGWPLAAGNTSVTASFWEAGLTGTVEPNPIGVLSRDEQPIRNLSGLSAGQLNDFSIYDGANWDIQDGWVESSVTNVWGICEEVARPFLLWQYTSTPCRSWWVAASGIAAEPASSGSSCANPSFVGNTQAAIQNAINSAVDGEMIRICDGLFNLNSTIDVSKNVNLVGFGNQLPVLDGGNATRIMSINGALNVNINGLHFRNGRANGDVQPGAGLQADPRATVTVEDSLFVNNVAEWHGGGISMVGDGNGSLSVLRSTFYKNQAEDGGAIIVVGDGRTANVSDSTFVSNYATREGGAIGGSFATVTASSSTFLDNGAANSGAAIYNVATNGNIFAMSSVNSMNAQCAGDRQHAMNVSTDVSCLTSGQEVVTYESIGFKFLGMWGGRTPTVPIGATSAAKGALEGAACTNKDQHGVSRISPCDAGATEYRANLPTISSELLKVAMTKGLEISDGVRFTPTGFTGPVVYRITTELNSLSGVSLSTAGVLSGTPASTFTAPYFVVTGTDTNGVVASGRIRVDNCLVSIRDEKYVISTAADLEIFRIGFCGLDKSYIQTADIAWNGIWNGPTLPSSPFTGTYDGGNHSVTGLQISGGRTGFIAHTNGARISNLNFAATVSGSYGSAGLVYSAKATTINNVHGSGIVSTPIDDPNQGCIGGLVGETELDTLISNSSYVGTIDASNGNWIGGLIGCAYTGTRLEGSFFAGTVNGLSDVGGLVGWMEFTDIRDSYAIGSVLGTGNENGGLVGWLDSDNSTDNDNFAIKNSYSSVVLTGDMPTGALLGVGQSTSISSSFWEERQTGSIGRIGLNAIGQLTDTDGEQPDLTATTATQMKTFSFFVNAGWNIGYGLADATERSTVWAMCDEEDRPFLFWQYSNTKCDKPATPAPDNDTQTTDTTSPSTTAPATPKADSVSATDAISTTPTTVVSVPASTSERVASTLNTAPKLATGAMAIFSAGKRMDNALKWSGNSTISGMIGGVKFTAKFNQGVTQINTPATVKAGSTFVLSLQGLKPGSKVMVTLYSLPTTLGEFVAASNGKVEAVVRVPASVLPGSHRLRVELVDQNAEEIAVWSGIRVTSDIMLLPATGSSSLPIIFIALWILIAGLALTVRKRVIF